MALPQKIHDMAQPQKSTPIKLRDGSKDKFYRFFKFQVDSITDACPNIVKSIQLTDGTKTWEAFPGNSKVIEFLTPCADGLLIKVKDKVTEVWNDSRTIIYEIENETIAGISQVKLEVAGIDDYARWTVYYKDTDPDQYLALLKSVSEAVDNYINTQN